MELPVSFLENMKKLLSPEEFNAYLDSYSEERVYGLRVNTNKLTPEEFEKISGRKYGLIEYVHSRLKRYRGLIMVIIIVEKISRQRILIIMPVCIICRSHQQ